jgi:hypothetical protein
MRMEYFINRNSGRFDIIMDHLRGNDVRLQISLLHEEHFDSLQQDTFVRCSPTFKSIESNLLEKLNVILLAVAATVLFESGFQLESVRECSLVTIVCSSDCECTKILTDIFSSYGIIKPANFEIVNYLT